MYNCIYANTTAYRNSYFPRTIIDWNSLSTSLIEMTDKKLFLDNICSQLIICK